MCLELFTVTMIPTIKLVLGEQFEVIIDQSLVTKDDTQCERKYLAPMFDSNFFHIIGIHSSHIHIRHVAYLNLNE